MRDKIKRFITCNVPVSACNFRCSYCYLPQKGNAYTGENTSLPYPIEYIAKCFSIERLGGVCHLNFCAPGETLLYKDIIPLVQALIREGHYCSIVTNGVLSNRFDEIIKYFSIEECKKLFIKFSFHWFQLREKGLLNQFVLNVNKMKRVGVSYTIEITPHDELVQCIDEIKEFCLNHFQALPHITVARNEGTKEIELLTSCSKEEYKKIWSVFDSALFDFKINTFNIKRDEFCRAGELTLNLDLGSGDYFQCFKGAYLGNIYNLSKSMNFQPIGKCLMPHCFNAHSYIALGAIKKLQNNIKIPTYAEERDRVCNDGTRWLQPEYNDFLSHYTWENSPEISRTEEKRIIVFSKFYLFISKFKFFRTRIFKKKLNIRCD